MLTHLDEYLNDIGRETRGKETQFTIKSGEEDNYLQHIRPDDLNFLLTTKTAAVTPLLLGKATVVREAKLVNVEKGNKSPKEIGDEVWTLTLAAILAADVEGNLQAYKLHRNTVEAFVNVKPPAGITLEDVADPEKVYYIQPPDNSLLYGEDSQFFRQIILTCLNKKWRIHTILSDRKGGLFLYSPFRNTPENKIQVEKIRAFATLVLLYHESFTAEDYKPHVIIPRRKMSRKNRRAYEKPNSPHSLFYVHVLKESVVARSTPSRPPSTLHRRTRAWEVRGHYRLQPYGKKNSLRKLIWINGHTKGEGEPLTPLNHI